ncbi:hypothetical protein H0H92_015008 [Tricholoma furcatifolium]|nr:hypothetical protein H0H92_015008 [Tricholoma furcatifolium]
MASISINEPVPPGDINAEQFRACSGCKTGRIPIVDYRKTCQTCREKSRLQAQRYKERKRERLRIQELQGRIRAASEMGVAAAEDGKNKRLKTDHVSDENKPVNVYKDEYQTASDMYRMLTMSSKSKRYSFYGHFSIVANPEAGNGKRVRIVSRDLRNIANIPFEYA